MNRDHDLCWTTTPRKHWRISTIAERRKAQTRVLREAMCEEVTIGFACVFAVILVVFYV
jgi:hypothetical protein